MQKWQSSEGFLKFLSVACLMLRGLFCAPVRPMRGFCSILIAIVMLVHFQCAASCLSESPGNTAQTTPVSPEPPCHQHANIPANSPHAPHETNTACTQGPVVEAKILLSGKWVQHLIAVLPVAVPILYLDEPAKLTFATYSPRDLWFPPISLSVLRI